MDVLRVIVFVAVEAAVLWACVAFVRRFFRVKKGLLFWFLKGEIDRRKDPVSYWFFAGQLVIFLAFLPTVIVASFIF